MDKLRRSFRSSFRRKDNGNRDGESSGPGDVGSGQGNTRLWLADEDAVKSNNCCFDVKYLGSVEVFESRGMQVCEEALKNLKNSKKKPIRGSLHISGDGLRVSDNETKGLVLDQTIEKVSFCAPDRNYDKGFSYICRDGTTRRWLCHGFMATRDSGERLSHAVGCAFALCLEKKQKRDKECAVQMSYDHQQNTFTRFGSFRQGTISDRLQDPQGFKPGDSERSQAPQLPVCNPNAVARPRASDLMYLRQASFRGLGQLSGSTPFKRQWSLRLNELPSTLARQARDNISDNSSTCQFSPIKEDADGDISEIVPKDNLSDLSDLLDPLSCSDDILQPTATDLTMALSPQLVSPPLIDHVSPSLKRHAPSSNTSGLASSSSNPWDNVPDQPQIRMATCQVPKPVPQPRPNSLAAETLPLEDWLTCQKLSNLTLLQPENQTKPKISIKSRSFDQQTISSPISEIPGGAHSMMSDPFDVDWVRMKNTEESRFKNSSNPFIQDGIKSFELKM